MLPVGAVDMYSSIPIDSARIGSFWFLLIFVEPLSITTSIITLLQATNTVISVCYDYSAALKGAPWELSKVLRELKGLRDVLESLEKLAKASADANPAAHSQLPTLELLCNFKRGSGPLMACLDEINRIKIKLSPPSWSGKDGSRRQAMIKALGRPLKEKDTMRSLQNIGRFKVTLTLALTSDQT